MNKVAILSDSTCDLSKELLEQYNIDAIPLHVSFDEESYKDGVDITLEELYNKAEKLGKLPKTSAPSQGEMTAFFKIIQEHLSHTSLSSSNATNKFCSYLHCFFSNYNHWLNA